MNLVNFKAFILSACFLALVACQSVEAPIDTGNGNQAGINEFTSALPAWETPRVENLDSRELTEGVVLENDTTYDCTVETRQLDPTKTTYKEIMLAGISADVLYPGSLLQGDDIEKGLLRSVRVDRAPITMTINLNIEDPSITVPNPTTATMRDAVSELIRRADTRLGEIDVVPGNIFYNKVEAHSFQQSMNEVGISAGYDDGIATKIDASFNFGSERKASSHTIMVYLVEPLFEISFAEDDLKSPADLFASTVTKGDLLAEENAGRMSKDNLPVYVKTVKYGRILMYTLTSSQVETFEELQAAVNGSYGAFSGGASYTQADRDIISESQETIIAFGGSQEASKAAILDLEKFFVPIEATQAVPISYEIRDLEGNVAQVGDITEYKVQNCEPRDAIPVGERVRVTLEQVRVHDACDSGAEGQSGEIIGNFSLNGAQVWSIPRNSPRETSDGDFISINQSRTFDLKYSPVGTVRISGTLADTDTFSTDDAVGAWNFTLSTSSGYGSKTSRSSPDCSSTLYYKFERLNYLY